MNYISENDGCTQADIAERLQVTAACVATSTKRLQKSGFITKTIDEDNLRCKRLSLTPLGKKALDEYDNYIFRNINADEIKNAEIFLDKLIYNMEEAIGDNHSGADFYEINKLIRRVREEKEENKDI